MAGNNGGGAGGNGNASRPRSRGKAATNGAGGSVFDDLRKRLVSPKSVSISASISELVSDDIKSFANFAKDKLGIQEVSMDKVVEILLDDALGKYEVFQEWKSKAHRDGNIYVSPNDVGKAAGAASGSDILDQDDDELLSNLDENKAGGNTNGAGTRTGAPNGRGAATVNN